MVDAEKILDVVDQIRVAIPAEVREAHEFLEKRESLINQSLLEARRIKTAADEESRGRVQDSEILKEARRRAEEILADAQRKAGRITAEAEKESSNRVAEADKYARESLYKLEAQLTAVLASVRKGIEVLEAEKEPAR